MGSQGIYTHTVQYERDASCPICSAGVALEVDPSSTLQKVCDFRVTSEMSDHE